MLSVRCLVERLRLFARNNVSIFVAHKDYGDIIATIFHNNFIENAHKPGGKPWWCSCCLLYTSPSPRD